MNIIYILVALWAPSADQISTQYVQKFTTITACEQAVRANSQGVVQTDYKQKRIFECVPYNQGK